MLKLTKVEINKYKSYNLKQEIEINDSITTLVGKNESGKSAFLEAIAKFNYFEDDVKFKFNETSDFPRNELKKHQRSGEDVEVVRCTFDISEDILCKIKEELGEGVFEVKKFSVSKNYENRDLWTGVIANEKAFIGNYIKKFELNDEDLKKLDSIENINELLKLSVASDSGSNIKNVINKLNADIVTKAYDWDNKIEGYIAKSILKPLIPKLWYFDEYYSLPSRININKLKSGAIDSEMNEEAYKTSKALFELAQINIDELIEATDFEDFVTELEATSNEITDVIFKYWTTNKNLEIEFMIDNKMIGGTQYKILDIRIKNTKYRVSLPLQNRSKGFIWFFSFIIWFSKIQSDKDKNFILLLDEPGLNLHAAAQADLLNFFEDLSKEYQIVYTTHSPFMINSNYLDRVRTVLDTDNGSVISDAIQEKDPDTLFPLQAALGYDIAQNLFISQNNLLVEGPADLIYLTVMSNILQGRKKIGLNDSITIVPIGGLDRVASFISLLRGSKLNVVTLLDSFTDPKGEEKVKRLIKDKIIKQKNIRFFHEFTDVKGGKADVEDMFTKEEYLRIFNIAFNEYDDIKKENLNEKIGRILLQINQYLNIKSFNHYKPANKLAQIGDKDELFSDETLNRFEKMFIEINNLFSF